MSRDMRRKSSSRAPLMICLMGPTGAGKTDLAVRLVSRLPVEIVSVDSAMVYRGMDIGTGKPERIVLTEAPHRLIDIRAPHETYSAAEFCRDARREIDDILGRGGIPLLVGGTGLYFRALRQGLSRLPPANRAVRVHLASQAAAAGWGALHRRLAEIDPRAAARIHPNDPQRIQRALEVYELTGRPMSQQLEVAGPEPFTTPARVVILSPGRRSSLHGHIECRFNRMLERGLVEEVAGLRDRPEIDRDLPSMRAVGYRQVWDYLEGRVDHATMRERSLAATRQLARRQLTWLRAEPEAVWVDAEDPAVLSKLLNHLDEVG